MRERSKHAAVVWRAALSRRLRLPVAQGGTSPKQGAGRIGRP